MKKEDESPADRAFIGPDMGNGSRPFVRQGEGHVTVGVIEPFREGVPLEGRELVQVETTQGGEHSMRTLYDGRKGPSKVSSPAYREGWDSIFGNKTVGQA